MCLIGMHVSGHRCLIAGCFLLLSVRAFAASIDCEKASTRVEKLICSDGSLSISTAMMEMAYAAARPFNPDAVDVDQQHWLKQREQCAEAFPCKIGIEKSTPDCEMNRHLRSPSSENFPLGLSRQW